MLPDFFVGSPAFAVLDEEEEEEKEMSGFSVDGEGCLVEEEKEWAKDSG